MKCGCLRPKLSPTNLKNNGEKALNQIELAIFNLKKTAKGNKNSKRKAMSEKIINQLQNQHNILSATMYSRKMKEANIGKMTAIANRRVQKKRKEQKCSTPRTVRQNKAKNSPKTPRTRI